MKPLYGIPIIYNTGAVYFGYISEKRGRRYSIMTALVLSMLSIPAWAFGGSVLAIVLGSYVMQTGVQGAFGVSRRI
jgi:SHS family lactate transporter-like MFS transporter